MKTQTKPKASSTAQKVTVNSTLERYTTLAELEKSTKGQVFVLNNLKGDSRGMIIVSVARRNGNGQDIVRIAGTFIPQDLTMQVSKVQLLESTEFRRTVHKGLVKLLNAEYAQKLLSSDEAKVEAQRVADSMSRAKVFVESQVLSSTSGGLAAMINRDEEDAGEDAEDGDDEETPVRPSAKAQRVTSEDTQTAKTTNDKPTPSGRFRNMIEVALREKHTPTEVIADLKNFKPLSKLDIKYALKHFKAFPRVATFLQREMEKAA